MKMWMPGRCARSTAAMRAVDVLLARARQREDDRLRHGGRHPLHRLEVAFRRGGEPGLDDVDAEALELASDHQLLLDVHRGARGLLPVAQRGVEDPYPVHRGSPFPPRGFRRSRLPSDPRNTKATSDSIRPWPCAGGCCLPYTLARAPGGLVSRRPPRSAPRSRAVSVIGLGAYPRAPGLSSTTAPSDASAGAAAGTGRRRRRASRQSAVTGADSA